MPYTPKPEHALQTSVANFFRANMPADVPLIEYRIYLPDGREVIERVIGLSMVAAYHPDAIRVERVDACGGFY